MVKIAGSYQFQASVDKAWPHIFDPQSLMGLIPGCQQLEQVSPNEYHGQIQVGVAGVSGTYASVVRVVEVDPLRHCRFQGEISGGAGGIQGEASFRLKEVSRDQSCIEYEAQGIITGALATLSPRFVEGVARTLINRGLANLNKQLANQQIGKSANQQVSKSAS
jgi:carbon monoxide dehydrogenase subunit G